ncbi:MAG TPA: hypothetical protein VJ570_08625 [Holophagaceae bacterium]|nr:hypothetical protein [Holophagaceae bacterium]
MTLPPAIPLVTFGECPHCGQALLGLASAKCSHCGRSLVPEFESMPSVAERLAALAPGWTVSDLLAWVRPRPSQLAWVHQNQQWPLLEHFVAEELWSDWQQWERARRSRGVSLQLDEVQVASVHLVGLGEWQDWAQVRIHGRRASYEWSLHSSLALSGSTSAAPFTELWWLEATGAPKHAADLRCGSCGGDVTFNQPACPYCGAGVTRPLGPWRLTRVDVVQEGLAESAWGERSHEDWQWVMENLIC